ncbi:hypothetical protein LR48_Vigan10g265800 [Vigna angularis]|uniref:Histone deacetylase interacting domain-containing protein n=1 Tax=Phaseolus angularis TaxID=3914 RepID=A0A0L9VNW9_PHAAN|nr:hypothetical protein LR48_Vigan10g265800 [Vigna angularis]
MKRARDDMYSASASQFKRPPFSSSRADSYAQVPGNGGGGGGGGSNGGGVGGGATTSQKLTTNDALSYLKEVKDMFQDQREKYDMFLEVMKDFKAQRTDTAGVIARKRFQSDEHVYKSFLDILNMYRKEHKDIGEVYSEQRYRRERLPSHDHDMIAERPEMDDDKTMLNIHKERKRDNRDRRMRDQDEREQDLDNSRDLNLQRFPDKKKAVKKAEGFGMASEFPSYEDKDTLKSMYSQAFSFCEKVKEKLSSSDDYQTFLKCLHIFSNGIIKRNDLQNLVTDLLGKHSDLMDEFNDFLERCENIESLSTDAHLARPSKLEDKDREHKRDMDGAKEKERYKEKYMGKSIQELDLSDCKRCTPSYRLLPADYPIPTASQRSELGAQVLNDHWVSVTSGSEDYSFKHMRRNQYEESLFRCEDDRYELDMLLESVSSAAKRAEELYNNINENKISVETLNRIEEHFTVLNLRCIERLYGDHGLDVIDILRKNPTHALPVILTRLKQKQEEWSRCRSDFNKVWAEIYAKNHYKSLDHRSFYFKQQDSKNLSTKSLVAEIKEIKEKQQKEDDIIQSIAAGNKQPLIPHLEFEYPDAAGIHEDLYKLVRYSCEELFSSKELLNKIMRLWSTFLEPMLGVPTQSHATERTEDRKTGHNVRNFGVPSIGDDRSPHGDSLSMNSRLPKSDKNEADGRLTDAKNVQRANMATNDKENGSVGGEHGCRDDPLMDKGLKNVECNDKASGFSKPFTSDDQGAKNSVSIAIRGENSLNRTNLAASPARALTPSQPTDVDDSVAKSQVANVPLVEGCDMATPVPVANGVLSESSKVKNHDESAGPCKIEKEEGELSPNGDSEEDNFVAYRDSNVQSMAKAKHNTERRKYQSRNGEDECCPEAGGDNDADADDEDSENVSEAGEDVSGSESAGDECFREDHEEEEDIEQDDVDGKAESEGEAEGICDAQAGGDGTSLPLSERFLSSVKPLTKHVSAVSFVEEMKESRVFYGNDDFYVLFRLHQTLYERILSAKTNSMNAELKWKAKDASLPDPYSSFKLLQLMRSTSSSPSRLSIQFMDNMNEKPELFAVSIDPNFSFYLHNDFLSVFPGKKEPHGIILHRNKRKYGNLDELSAICSAMEGVKVINGLECKISCNSSKISYVLDTQDFFFRPRKRRRTPAGTTTSQFRRDREERFRKLLACS